MKTSTRDQGFTLAELLVVVVVIAVLAAIAVPIFLSQTQNAQIAALKSDLINAITLLEEGEVLNQADPNVVLPDVFPANVATVIPNAGSLDPGETIHVTQFGNLFCVDGTTDSGYPLAYSRSTGFQEGTCAGPGPGPDPDPTVSPTPSPTGTTSPSPSPTGTASPSPTVSPTVSPTPTPTPDQPGVWRDAIFVPAKYTCPVGATLDGTDCVTKETIPGYYSCPNGGNLVGDKCETSVYVPGYTYYTCPNGGTLNGTTCTTTYTYYDCPNGGTLNGTTCTLQTITGYYCDTSGYPAGDIISGPNGNNQCTWQAWDCSGASAPKPEPVSQWSCGGWSNNRPSQPSQCVRSCFNSNRGESTNQYTSAALVTRGGFAATPRYSNTTYGARANTGTSTYNATANTSPGYWTTQTNPATWNPPINRDKRVPATYEPARYECEPGGSLNGTRCFYPYG